MVSILILLKSDSKQLFDCLIDCCFNVLIFKVKSDFILYSQIGPESFSTFVAIKMKLKTIPENTTPILVGLKYLLEP